MNNLSEVGNFFSFEEISPEPQPAGSGIIPPSRRTRIGMFDANNGGNPPIDGTSIDGREEPEGSDALYSMQLIEN